MQTNIKFSLQPLCKRCIIVNVNPSLASFDALVKDGFLDSSRAGWLLVAEAARFFEYPKPEHSQTKYFSEDKFDSTLLLKFPKMGKGIKIIMSMKLYVGNLSFDTTTQDLEQIFGEIGTVESSNLIEDRDTGRSRGFAFVEMSSQEEGQNAISQLNGKEVDGRELKVNEAKPQEKRSGGGGGGYGGGGGRGGYGGGGGNRGGGGGGSRW
ncbi:hypothetical protein BH18ACI1_BH18ACI1_19470 [soil metagenome]